MKISLRKASALQNAIQETLRSIKIEPVIQLSEYVPTQKTIIEANTALITNDARRVALTVAYYNVRSLVGTANVSCGINMKLATAAFIDRRIAQLNELINAGVRNIDVVEKKIEKIRQSDSNQRLYGQSEVSTAVLTEDQHAAFKSEIQALKKQKQNLNDEILELNIKTEITFGEQTLVTLTSEGLL